MPLHDAAFCGMLAFLLGIAAASMGVVPGALAVLAAVAFFACIFLRRRLNIGFSYLCAGFAVLFLGYAYFHAAAVLGEPAMPEGPFEALVVRDPKRGDRQELVLDLLPPASGGALFYYAPRYPAYAYGDVLRFESGTVGERYEQYVLQGNAERVASDRGNAVRGALYRMKRAFVSALERALPRGHAALLAGITVGERGEFPAELTAALRASGTTHITALSGYNIAVLALALGTALSHLLASRQRFFLTLGAIAAFVVATGAEASVVRAGIMGGILLLARETGRVHSVRNAVATTAFGMALADPRVLVFDLGFQLSFLSLFGIIALMPRIEALLAKAKRLPSFFREPFAATAAAQLAVLPLLLAAFGTVSLVSLPANVLVLAAVPLTMALGFAAGIVGLISAPLAGLVAVPAQALLSYELAVIGFFGRAVLGATIEFAVSWPMVAGYYALLGIWIMQAQPPRIHDER